MGGARVRTVRAGAESETLDEMFLEYERGAMLLGTIRKKEELSIYCCVQHKRFTIFCNV